MKKFKNISRLIMFFSLLVSLTACGGGSKPTSSSTTTNADISNPETDNEIREIYELYQQNGGELTYEEWLATIKGEKGDKGDTGDTGPQGEKGDKGDPGEPGKDGQDGADGKDGAPGKDGIDGEDGKDGLDGKDGKDGSSILTGNGVPDSTLGNNGDSYINLDTWDYYVKEDNSWILKGNIKGESGETLKDHNGTEGLDFYPINQEECAVGVGTAKLLKEIVVPEYYKDYKVVEIIEMGFAETKVETIKLPNTLLSIGSHAFYNCESLISIEIPDSVTSIGDYAFSSCYSLTSIVIPDSVTQIGRAPFSNCASLQFNVYDNCAYLGNSLNPYVVLISFITEQSTYSINSNCKFIHSNAFSRCSSLSSIEIPNSVTSIGDFAFSRCSSLSSIVIPDSVTSIGDSAFDSCDYLIIYCEVSSQPSGWDSDWDHNGLIYWAGEWEYDLNGNPVRKTLDKDYYTEGLIFDKNSVIGYEGTDKDVIIPTEYNGYTITNIGDSAFSNCTSLISVVIPDSVTQIGDAAFYACESLTSIVIPNSVTSIGNSAFFNCYFLRSIVIPNSVTSIGSSAFAYCNSLQFNVYDNCTYLGNSLNPYVALISYITEQSTYSINSNCKLICGSAFRDCTSLTSIVIPNSVTSIGNGAFFHCYSLASIVIPNSVTSINRSTFVSCISLTSIEIPNSVTSIGSYAFSGCTSLTSIVIPNNVTYIGERAFSGCTSLTSIVIPNNVTYIGERAFYESSSLTIYCEASSQPSEWHLEWNFDYGFRPVYWAGEWEYDSNGNPTPLN